MGEHKDQRQGLNFPVSELGAHTAERTLNKHFLSVNSVTGPTDGGINQIGKADTILALRGVEQKTYKGIKKKEEIMISGMCTIQYGDMVM